MPPPYTSVSLLAASQLSMSGGAIVANILQPANYCVFVDCRFLVALFKTAQLTVRGSLCAGPFQGRQDNETFGHARCRSVQWESSHNAQIQLIFTSDQAQ
jgi:hypothetical protein